MERTQLAVYRLGDPRQVAGVAADCELSKTVSVILLISFDSFRPPPEKAYTNSATGTSSPLRVPRSKKWVVLHTGRYVVRDEEGTEEVVIGEPTFQIGNRLICNDGSHQFYSVALMQDLRRRFERYLHGRLYFWFR